MQKPLYSIGDYVLISPSNKDWATDFYIQAIIGGNEDYKYICSSDKEGLHGIFTCSEGEIQYKHQPTYAHTIDMMDQYTLEKELLALCGAFPDIKHRIPFSKFVYFSPEQIKKYVYVPDRYQWFSRGEAEETITRYLREFANNQDFHAFIVEMEKMEVKNRKIFFLAIEHMKQK